MSNSDRKNISPAGPQRSSNLFPYVYVSSNLFPYISGSFATPSSHKSLSPGKY